MCLRIVGIEAQCRLVERYRTVQVTLPGEEIAKVAAGRSMIGLELKHLAIAGLRLFDATEAFQRKRHVVPGVGVIGSDLDRLQVAGESLGEALIFLEDIAQVVVSDGMARVDRDRLAIGGFGFGHPAEPGQRHPVVVADRRMADAFRPCPGQRRFGLGVPAKRKMGRAEQVVCHDGARIAFQQLFRLRHDLRHLALPVSFGELLHQWLGRCVCFQLLQGSPLEDLVEAPARSRVARKLLEHRAVDPLGLGKVAAIFGLARLDYRAFETAHAIIPSLDFVSVVA